MNLEKMQERLDKWYKTATPEQVVAEFEAMGVIFEDIPENELKIEFQLFQNIFKELTDLILYENYYCDVSLINSCYGKAISVVDFSSDNELPEISLNSSTADMLQKLQIILKYFKENGTKN